MGLGNLLASVWERRAGLDDELERKSRASEDGEYGSALEESMSILLLNR
jgi:hypothetical protein